ncbi:MAG: RIP metalloprotease RseP, partial [Bacteroidetes bacterium]
RSVENKDLIIHISEKGLMGVYPKGDLSEFFEMKKVEYSLVEAIPAGVSKGYDEIGNYLKQFKLIFNTETKAYESVGGFIAIGNIFPSTWDWQIFWSMTALLSIMLAVINILPIPALDGGHVLFLFFEIISGRKPSDKFLEYAQIVGMVLLFSLLIFANGNDIVKLFN